MRLARTSFYIVRERAALAWTEAVTSIASGGVPDELFGAARAVFREAELGDLNMAVIAINWLEPHERNLPRFTGRLQTCRVSSGGAGTDKATKHIHALYWGSAIGISSWTIEHLADECGVFTPDLSAFEQGGDVGSRTVTLIARALESAGAKFLPEAKGRGAGVGLKFAK